MAVVFKIPKEAEVYAIVELMGHVRLAGRLSEEEKFGSKIGRLDIPTSEKCACPNGSRVMVDEATVPCDTCHGSGLVTGWITQFFGGGSVYRITIVTEEVARNASKSTSPAPVHPWDYPKQLTAKEVPPAPYVKVDTYEPHDDDDGNDDYDDVPKF